jgi:hypothetical protein
MNSIPLVSQCARCREWFNTVHVCTIDASRIDTRTLFPGQEGTER